MDTHEKKASCLARTPARINIRIYEYRGYFYVIVRTGEVWESIGLYTNKADAEQSILDHYDKKLGEWSLGVKIAGGWVCKDCGELDRRLLESHHIKPKDLYPELMYELSNGKCICMRCHAKAHTGRLREMILERLSQVA